MARITPSLYKLAYKLGRRVYAGNMDRQQAEADLERAGMNRTSASFSIGNLRQMLNGAAYHRAMSEGQTRYFLTAIHQDDGHPGLSKAIAAFEAHLPYLRTSNGNGMPGLTALLQEFQQLANLPASDEDCLDDLPHPPSGVVQPGQQIRTSTRYKRDPLVRAFVCQRAKGKCEFCGNLGFLMRDGQRYLETHHIIRLASQGPDTVGNVIALCANDHREAHFGKNAEMLEKRFAAILADFS